MKDKITKGMLGYISLVTLAILTAILLHKYGIVDLSDAYNWF